MTDAGWYPDPAGTPNTYRYWDGQAWSEHTSTDPYGAGSPPPPPPRQAPSTPPAPPPYAGPSAPQQPPTPPTYGAMTTPPWSQQPSRGRGGDAAGGGPQREFPGRTIAIVLAAVLVLVLLGVLAFVGVKVLGDDDTVTHGRPDTAGTPDVPSASEPSLPTPTLPTPTAPASPLGTITPTVAQCDGGGGIMTQFRKGATISAGGLTAPSLSGRGFALDPLNASGFAFATHLAMVSKEVAANWMSPLILGELPKADGFRDTEQAARTVMECLADNPQMYHDAYRLSEVSAGATDIDGHRAFSLIEDIRVHDPSVTVPGDRVQVIVVDTGRRSAYGIYVMAVPLGDKALLALQKSTAEQLHAR